MPLTLTLKNLYSTLYLSFNYLIIYMLFINGAALRALARLSQHRFSITGAKTNGNRSGCNDANRGRNSEDHTDSYELDCQSSHPEAPGPRCWYNSQLGYVDRRCQKGLDTTPIDYRQHQIITAD